MSGELIFSTFQLLTTSNESRLAVLNTLLKLFDHEVDCYWMARVCPAIHISQSSVHVNPFFLFYHERMANLGHFSSDNQIYGGESQIPRTLASKVGEWELCSIQVTCLFSVVPRNKNYLISIVVLLHQCRHLLSLNTFEHLPVDKWFQQCFAGYIKPESLVR